MAEKKSFWTTLFGGKSGSCCNMQVTPEQEQADNKKKGCCDMVIEEESSDHDSAEQGQ